MTYVVGQRVTLSTEVRDKDGNLANTTLALVLTRPDGTTATPTVTTTGTGLYSADITVTQAGDWLRVWTGTGAVEVADADQFHVIAPALRIVGLAEVKLHGNITGTASDNELLDFIGTAQQMIEDKVGAVVPTTVIETYSTTDRTRVWLDRTPVLSVASVQEIIGGVTQTALAASAYEVDLASGALTRLSGGAYTYWSGTYVLVTYRPGRAPIPEAIRWAGKELTIHLWRSTQTQRGGRGRGDVESPAGYGIPNRVADALQPFLQLPAVA